MADRILQFLDSEDDQSDFEGFNESDIEMSLHSESSSSEDDEIGNNSSDDENLDPNLDGWTRQFSPITVCVFILTIYNWFCFFRNCNRIN